jgi:hypothetical protein
MLGEAILRRFPVHARIRLLLHWSIAPIWHTTKALTALWREFIDAGMFANFPGFLYLKGADRQLTNQFRVAPGSGLDWMHRSTIFVRPFEQFEAVDRVLRQALPVRDKLDAFHAKTKSLSVCSRQPFTASGAGVR